MISRVETHYKLAGFGAAFFITAFILIAFIALSLSSQSTFDLAKIINDEYLANIIKFTLKQAALSTFISVTLAVFVATALARRTHFFGRNFILKLFALPLALPPLVGVLAVLGLWGNAGWIKQLAISIGFDEPAFSVFGLSGILIAHVFFNLPLATRLLLERIETTPSENWRLAAQLGLPHLSVFKLIEWPAIKTVILGITALVFMLCLTSFTIVLTLGGGPSSTTLEVAIYQALRFDFDPARAVTLALIQLIIIGGFLALSFKFTKTLPQTISINKISVRPQTYGRFFKSFDHLVLAIASLFIILPLLTILTEGVTSDLKRLLTTPKVWSSILTSLILAITSASLAVAMCWTMIKSIKSTNSKYAQAINIITNSILVMPAIVLGAGWFVLLQRAGMVFSFTPFLVIIINAFMALPFLYRILSPAIAQANSQNDKLATSLGIASWTMFLKIDLPSLKRPIALSFAFAMALSIGDLGVIALFGSQDFSTLPLLLFQSLGSYRTQDAQGLAFILATLSLGILYLGEQYARQPTAKTTKTSKSKKLGH